MKELIIIGNSANSKLARYYFEKDLNYKVRAYAVNQQYREQDYFDNLPVVNVEDLKYTYPPEEFDCFVAVGYNKMNQTREKLYKEIKAYGYMLPNYISPRCSYLTEIEIGDNNLILEDNTIQPFVKIGSNNVFWSGNHIGHDGEIGNHNFITSHVVVSGFVKIGSNCFIGVNSTIRDSIQLADRTLIAAGAIINKDTRKDSVHVPARSTILGKKSFELNI